MSATVLAQTPVIPAPPVAPASMARDADGRVTLRAERLAAPLRVDGRLDESLYTSTEPMSGFTQNEPRHGEPSTEKTEVWISFDDDNVYVSVRAWESQPERMIASEMRRDSQAVLQSENFAFAFDTFHDKRNEFLFQFNPVGGRMDGQVTNEGTYNGDWNPVWRMAVGRFEGGWTGEAAVPFKSLRYQAGREQVWGFNARRINRWRNEVGFLTPMIRGVGNRGIFMASQHATLVGIVAPEGSRTFELKPYAISSLTSDNLSAVPVRNDLAGEVGLDAKVGLTQTLTADITVNTDFAQVEADEQQVNLTRFSLFFPEKRDFFLENQGFFLFAPGANVGANTAGNGVTNANLNNTSNTPVLFYSRRIGLEQGREIPIVAGGRASGKVGNFTVGLLNIQSGADDEIGLESTNFTVMRVKRDILRRSYIGAAYTGRSPAATAAGAAHSYGVDGSFVFFDNLGLNAYWARTSTPLVRGGDTSSRANLDYNGDRYAVNVERLTVGEHFNPEVGFIRRGDMDRSFALFRFSPRPGRRVPAVRKFSGAGSVNYIENTHGRLETREVRGEFRTEFQNSDSAQLAFTREYEYLARPFLISQGVVIPGTAGYDFGMWAADWTRGRQHLISGTVSLEHGSFYGGHRTTVGFSGGRVSLSTRLAVEPGASVNHVTLPFGDFTATLVTSRVTYTMTPLMFASALVQYNSGTHAVSTNVRFRWEYLPGSELFVVLNDTHDTEPRGGPGLQNRSIVVKINRLFRF